MTPRFSKRDFYDAMVDDVRSCVLALERCDWHALVLASTRLRARAIDERELQLQREQLDLPAEELKQEALKF